MTLPFIHLSFYRFTPLAASDLPERKTVLKKMGLELGLRGTILLAQEGINAMLTGSPDAIAQIKRFAQTEYFVENNAIKEAAVSRHAFARYLVKIKKEIISLGTPNLLSTQKTGPRVTAKELKQWLDEGRPVELIDTRNKYEFDVGTFNGAADLAMDSFREFAEKAKTLATQYAEHDKKNTPLVTFCTGGIRCEKATALLLALGLKNVYQLDGGILRYLEENGDAHFKGSCFVFDERLAVNGALSPVHRSVDAGARHGRHRRPPVHDIKNS